MPNVNNFIIEQKQNDEVISPAVLLEKGDL